MRPVNFQYAALPARVVFGSGTLTRLPEESARLQLKRVLIISSAGQRGQAGRVKELLGPHAVGAFTKAAMHTPAELTAEAMDRVAESRADGFVAIGGGSAIGLSKALAFRTDLPQIVIPTTYAGSEATPVLGETVGKVKYTRRSDKILPETILYDVELTLGLPVSVSMASGLNAMAHAIEALYAPDRNPLTSLMAQAALEALIDALPQIHTRADNLDARTTALWGAWLAGSCLGMTTMGLHHKLCHTLGGTFGLPHAETHAVLLPHVLAYNLPFDVEALHRMRRSFSHDEPAVALAAFNRRLSLPNSLRELQMVESALDSAVDLTVQRPYPNPRPLERDAIRQLLSRAWAGKDPLSQSMEAEDA